MTHLSPYISRGAISTKTVFEHLKTLHLQWFKVERLVQELAWRDFFQEIYKAKQDLIFSDVKLPQENVENWGISSAIVQAKTGIEIIDDAISQLYTNGYIHNHLRMYIASITCNIAHSHWLNAAKWMYFNLLDGDLASNHLSWQWVAGSFSTKKYFANQENFNKYFGGNQINTFMDVNYSELPTMETPEILKDIEEIHLKTNVPNIENPIIKNEKTLLYNYYNLDFNWHSEENLQRIFLIEPSHFDRFPVSDKCLNFALKLSENIPNLKIFIGEFSELNSIISAENINFKEHPTNAHYLGKVEKRTTLTELEGDFPSFFNFWKKAKKILQKDFEN